MTISKVVTINMVVVMVIQVYRGPLFLSLSLFMSRSVSFLHQHESEVSTPPSPQYI